MEYYKETNKVKRCNHCKTFFRRDRHHINYCCHECAVIEQHISKIKRQRVNRGSKLIGSEVII